MNLLGFFTLNPAELLIILILALLFFGAKRLPELARSLGSAINEFNKAKEDVHRQITQTGEPAQPQTPPASPQPQQPQAPQQPGVAPTAPNSQPKA